VFRYFSSNSATMSAYFIGKTNNDIPFVRVGDDLSTVVLNGGQGFVRQASPKRMLRDAKRIAKILPAGQSFVLLGYRADPPTDLSIGEIVIHTASAIRELVPAQQVNLVGVSYGGMIACRVSASFPDVVRRLVLVASAHRFSHRGTEHVLEQVASLKRGDLIAFSKSFMGLFRRPWLNALAGLSIFLGQRRIMAGMASTPAIIRYLQAMLYADPADLGKVRVPALVIGGAADQFFGDGVMAEMVAALPSGELHILPDETHMAPVEDASSFRNCLTKFLAQH
jgi:pimeloyl-ACP methyl ester carboxylesterase